MGKVHWPLVDLRKSASGEWVLEYIVDEPFVVPTTADISGFYSISLVEVPADALLDGSNSPPAVECPVGTPLTIINSGNPQITEVSIDYSRGILSFHPSLSGQSGKCTYYGKGSLIEATDLNDLDQRIIALYSGASAVAGETGFAGPQGSQGIKGSDGEVGSTGLQGETGLLGEHGLGGLPGLIGVRGLTGLAYNGSTGIQGFTGSFGSEGPSGFQGETGVSSIDGSPGTQGTRGLPPVNEARYESGLLSGTVWSIPHDLGQIPVVQLFSTSGELLEPQTLTNGEDISYVAFPTSTDGYAVCILGGLRGLEGVTGAGRPGETGITLSLERFYKSIPSPTSEWKSDHDLGYRPVVQIFDDLGRELNPIELRSSPTSLDASFSVDKSGYILAIGGGSLGETGPQGSGVKTWAYSVSFHETSLASSSEEIQIPNSGRLRKVTILSGETGVVGVQLDRSDFSSYPEFEPVMLPSLNLQEEVSKEYSNLHQWDVHFNSGDILRVSVPTGIDVEHLTIGLEMDPDVDIYSSSSSSTSSSSTSSSSTSSSSRSFSSSSSSSSHSDSSSSRSSSSTSSSSSSSSTSSSSSSYSSSSTVDRSWDEPLRVYDKHLISVWECDDQISTTHLLTDSVDGNDGVAYGGVGSTANGKEGSAVTFNGSNAHIEISHKTDLIKTSGTFAFWARVDNPFVQEYFLDKALDWGGSISLLKTPSSTLFRLREDASSYKEVQGPELISGWHHFAISWGENDELPYLDQTWTPLLSSLDSDLEYYWDFEETSGNFFDQIGNVELDNNSIENAVFGPSTTGIRFTSDNAYLSSPTLAAPLTVSVWVKPNSNVNRSGIVSKLNYNTNTSYRSGFGLLGHTNGVQAIIYTTGTSIEFGDCVATIPEGGWSHVVMSVSAGLCRLYVNGELAQETPFTGSINYYYNPSFYLGYFYDTTQRYYNGDMDDLAIWSVALDGAFIKELYNNGVGRFRGVSAPVTNPSTLSLFVDGIEYGYEQFVGTLYDDQVEPLNLARRVGANYYLDGALDTIYYWDQKVPPELIKRIYNEGYGRYYSSSSSSYSQSSSSTEPFPPEEPFDSILSSYDGSLKHAWRLNEALGPVVEDQRLDDDGLEGGDPKHNIVGKAGYGVSLDGIHDLIRVKDSSTLDPSEEMTLAFWMRSYEDTSHEFYKGLIDKANGDPRWNGGFFLGLDNRSSIGSSKAITFGFGKKPEGGLITYDPYTKIVAHFNGNDLGEDVFEAESRYDVSMGGNAVIDYDQGVFGPSAYFDGTTFLNSSGDSTYYSLDFQWTIELWFKYIPTSGYATILSTRGAIDLGFEIGINYNQNITFESYGYGSYIGQDMGYQEQTSGFLLRPGNWYHLAVEGTGSTIKTYINGQEYMSFPFSSGIYTTNFLSIGKSQNYSDNFTGWIDELRITSGLNRYGGPFIPYSREYDAGSFPWDEINLYTTNLRAAYNLEDEREIVSGLDLTNHGVSFDEGKDSLAAVFDSSNSEYLESPLSTQVLPKEGLTVSVWAWASDWAGTGMIASTYEGSGYEIGLLGSNEVFRLRRGSTTVTLSYNTGGNFQNGSWHHFVATYDGQHTKLYIDGILRDQNDAGSYAEINYSNILPLLIGSGVNSSGDPTTPYWDGKIDSLYLWDTALDERAISRLYNDQTGSFFRPTIEYEPSDFNYLTLRCQNAIKDNDWHHVVFTWKSSGNRVRLYIDGESQIRDVLEYTGNIELGDSDLDLVFGHFQGDADWPQLYFHGLLDEIYIWESELNSTAVASLFNSGAGRFFSSSSSSSSNSSSSSTSHSSSSTSPSSSHSSSSSLTPDRTWSTELELYDSNLFAWNLNETSGTREGAIGGYDLEDYGGVDWAYGRQNKAASFDGSSRLQILVQFLGYDPAPTYDADTPVIMKGDFTLSLWAMASNTPTLEGLLLSKYDELYDYQFQLVWKPNGKIAFRKDSGLLESSEQVIYNGIWNHILLVGDQATNSITWYLNNILVGTQSWHSADSQNAGLFIGGPAYGTTGWFNGRIDEVYYWDVKLPSDLYDDLYNYSYGKFYAPSSSSSSTSFSSSSTSSSSTSSSSMSFSSTSFSSSSSSLSNSSSSSSSSLSSESFSSSSSSSGLATHWTSLLEDSFEPYLIAAWTFDDGLGCHDLFGGYIGTPYGTVQSVAGKKRRAIKFSGKDTSFMEMQDLDLVSYDRGAFSIWVRIDEAVGGNILQAYYDEDNYWALIYFSDNRISLRIRYNGSQTESTSSYDVVSVGEWFHLYGRYDGTYGRIYLNGPNQICSVYERWWHNCTPYGGEQGRAGHRSFSLGKGLNGSIDSLYLWKDNYVDSAISTLYNSGAGHFYEGENSYLVASKPYNFVVRATSPSAPDTYLRIQTEGRQGEEYYIYKSGDWATKVNSNLSRRLYFRDNTNILEFESLDGNTEYLGYKDGDEYRIAGKIQLTESKSLDVLDLYCSQIVVEPGKHITQDLRALYRFNDGIGTIAKDDSPYGADMTLYNFPSDPWRKGRVEGGGALYFDGGDSYLENSEPSSSGGFGGWFPSSFTIAFWAYPYGRANYDWKIGASAGWGTFLFHTNENGAVYCGIDDNPRDRFDDSNLPNGTLELNVWQHFCFTFNNGFGRFYKNGELLSSKDGMIMPLSWTGFRIGWPDSNTPQGLIEEFRVYDRALSIEEVSVLGNKNLLDLQVEIREGNKIGEGTLIGYSTRTWLPSPGWFSFVDFKKPDLSQASSIFGFDEDLLGAWNMADSQGNLLDSSGDNDLTPDGDISYEEPGI